jgi:hypothetical protein
MIAKINEILVYKYTAEEYEIIGSTTHLIWLYKSSEVSMVLTASLFIHFL